MAERAVAVIERSLGAKHAYVLARDWLGEPPTFERERALAELARRYLAGHGAADDRDLAKWAGLPLRDVRAGLEAIGPWDPVLLGWRSREEITQGHQAKITIGGLFKPFALVDGRAAATWSLPGGKVAIEPFGRLAVADTAALDVDARDVERFLAAPNRAP